MREDNSQRPVASASRQNNKTEYYCTLCNMEGYVDGRCFSLNPELAPDNRKHAYNKLGRLAQQRKLEADNVRNNDGTSASKQFNL